MKYHVIFETSKLGGHWWINLDRETLMQDVILPFLNKQIVPVRYEGQDGVLNLSAAIYMRIFKTEHKIRNLGSFNGLWIRLKASECTLEILDDIRLQLASVESRSLLQHAFATPATQVFVIMKFNNKLLDSAYAGVIKPLAAEYCLKSLRVDEIQDSGRITDQILTGIAQSCLVVCDLSGERPNCYYEAGFAHALGKPIILTIRKDSQIHFDLAANRFIVWETEQELREALRARLDALKKQGIFQIATTEQPNAADC